MKLKLDDQGHAVLVDGMPVYIHTDGKEAPFDAASTIKSVNARAEQSERVETENRGLKERLKAFDGITDGPAALKALATVKNLGDKQLVDAGEVEKVKEEAIKSVRAEFAPMIQELEQNRKALHDEKIGGSFSRSKLIADKLAIPADLVQAAFGKNFSIEDGKVIAKDMNGKQIFSRTRHGEPADFDEAMEILVDQYPHKDRILKADNKPGTSTPANSGGGGGGGKTIKRDAFDALDPASKQDHFKAGGSVVD